jgi:hypothetical protein
VWARRALRQLSLQGTTVASRGFGWRIHCGVEVTESSTNKQLSLS